MLRLSLFSLEKEEEDHSEHGTQQEDRILLSIDVKGLVGLWDHGKGCCSLQAKALSLQAARTEPILCSGSCLLPCGSNRPIVDWFTDLMVCCVSVQWNGVLL